MTSDIGQFERFEQSHGAVSVGGGNTLSVEGLGTVLLDCILPNNNVHNVVRLNSVLYVPSFGHSLLSWNVLASKGDYMWHRVGKSLIKISSLKVGFEYSYHVQIIHYINYILPIFFP